jgi:hypothetical protein
MNRSPKHSDARLEAQRLPALNASLALLAEDTMRATIALYGTAKPTPGDPPGADPVATFTLGATAGTVDADLKQIQLAAPIEAQITGADPETGTEALWGRIFDGAGDWWGDATVSDESGDGEIKLQTTALLNGAFCRITSGVFQG